MSLSLHTVSRLYFSYWLTQSSTSTKCLYLPYHTSILQLYREILNKIRVPSFTASLSFFMIDADKQPNTKFLIALFSDCCNKLNIYYVIYSVYLHKSSTWEIFSISVCKRNNVVWNNSINSSTFCRMCECSNTFGSWEWWL